MEDRISVDPNICSGKPCITGTRIMVKNILGMIAGGYTIERILEAYPELNREDVIEALKYATQVIDEEEMTWMQLSAKAFKRDWDSEEDIIYDSKNC